MLILRFITRSHTEIYLKSKNSDINTLFLSSLELFSDFDYIDHNLTIPPSKVWESQSPRSSWNLRKKYQTDTLSLFFSNFFSILWEGVWILHTVHFLFFISHVFLAQSGKRDRDNYKQFTTMFLNFQQISGWCSYKLGSHKKQGRIHGISRS